MTCTNVTDRFTVGNIKAKLTYPVGLITTKEAELMETTTYAKPAQNWWLSSPVYFNYSSAASYNVNASSGGYGYTSPYHAYSARPSVSLASTVEMAGDGTMDSPYIVKTN